jgi:hypothetical protein
MLLKVSETVQGCYERAAECRRSAEAAADPMVRAKYLNLENRWLRLARSYEFIEQLAAYLENTTDIPAKPN